MPKITLQNEIRACIMCDLHEGCTAPVPYSGKPKAIMVVGEAPGRVEDAEGRPFVGPAGQLLWKELERIGVLRQDVFAANAVCCYPHGTPTEGQIYACRTNLYRQVQRCKPAWILALGKTANWSFGKRDGTLNSYRGAWYTFPWEIGVDVRVFPTYHPAAVLRDKTLTRAFRSDLAVFAEELFLNEEGFTENG